MQQNQTVILGQPPISPEAIDVTYAELLALRDAGEFTPLALYRITDFQTLHLIPNTTDRNDTYATIPLEVLIVQAASAGRLYNVVCSESFPNDIIHYDIDNSAWKNLLAAGAKGCITLRIDPKRNIEVGNGDWRNFIVRRWAVDLSSFGRGTRWLIWNTSVYTGTGTSGASHAFTAVSTTVYNASTNPNGFKDVRMFIPQNGLTRATENIRIKSSHDGAGTVFPMPNIYIDTNTATQGHFNNVVIDQCGSNSFTDEVVMLQVGAMDACIFTDIISFVSGFSGFIIALFSTVRHFANGIVNNINGGTILGNREFWGFSGELSNIGWNHISFLVGPLINNANNGITKIRNTNGVRFEVQLGDGQSYLISDLSYRNTIADTWQGFTLKDLSAFKINTMYDHMSYSNIECTVEANAVLTQIPVSRASNDIGMFAGVINLTGSAPVAIAALTRFASNRFKVVLKPQTGLTITIAHNNITNGFVQAATIVANGTNGEVIILTPIGTDRWTASN